MLKKILFTLAGLVVLVVVSGAWLFSLLDDGAARQGLEETRPQDLSYLSNPPPAVRGRILAVVTSTDTLGDTGKYTGYELTELARPYYVFTANGFAVDIASPKGGEPPAVIDTDDMGAIDYAFLNDATAQDKVKNSIPVDEVDANNYSAVYFVGGKGTMFDFPENAAIQSIVAESFEAGKVIAAVCHGPAALVNVKLSNGQALLAGKPVSSFTNEEELFLIPNAREVFPFLLQDGLTAQGAQFVAGPIYLEQISHDGNLITGQNPWSTWTVAERVVRQLGYTPVHRKKTVEEHTVAVLHTYETHGYEQAEAHVKSLLVANPLSVDRNLMAVHGLVAAMQWRLRKSIDLVRLVRLAKRYQGQV